MRYGRIGALMYVAWGLLHLEAAREGFALAAGLVPGLVRGKLEQGAWDLVFFALFAVVVALRLNWNNSRLGFWLNLAAVSAADIGFILFVLIPGYVAILPGVLGPVFWLAGLVLTGMGTRCSQIGA